MSRYDIPIPDELGEAISPEDAAEGIVTTAGFSSGVFDGDGEIIGHTLLLDLDDVEQSAVKSAAESTDGVTAVFESSPGSYHLWDLEVRAWEDAILEGLSWYIADAEHIQQSYRRGRYVIRAVGKMRDSGETYKDAPTLKAIYCDTDTNADISAPHLAWIRQTAAEHGVDDPTTELSDDQLVGDPTTLRMEQYMTIDDETKEAIRHD